MWLCSSSTCSPSNEHHDRRLFVCSRSSPSVFSMKNSELLDREISLAEWHGT
jgi:hypothetical protein